MADCCSSNHVESKPAEKRKLCPSDHRESQQVPFKTILQHVKKPWQDLIAEQQYYYCESPECEIVYFGEDNSVIKQSELRSQVGIKSSASDDALICYCFDVSVAEARQDESVMQFVTEKTKNQLCSCEIQNPSGRCCLKDFKRLYKNSA